MNVTFVANGHTAPCSTAPAQEPTLTPWGREQMVSLRKMFFEPPAGPQKRKGWKSEQFHLALVEPTSVSRDTALIVLRRQTPMVPMLYLPALLPFDGQTADDIAKLYQQFGNGPLRNWVDAATGEIQSFGAWVNRASAAINDAISTTRARHTIVIGQGVLLAGVAMAWTNDAASFPLLLDIIFAGGEAFRLDSETGAVALIKH